MAIVVNDNPARRDILRVLSNINDYARGDVLKALHDLRYNTGDGDEVILNQLMEHEDDGVVASVIFTLWHAYGQRKLLEPQIQQLAWGDVRDSGEMPIQSMAITLLAEMAKTDSAAHEELKQIAEDQTTADVPRKNAWQFLAEMHGVDWSRDYSNEMIMSPESDTSESIRQQVRMAMRPHSA